jgi:hypothetical protein
LDSLPVARSRPPPATKTLTGLQHLRGRRRDDGAPRRGCPPQPRRAGPRPSSGPPRTLRRAHTHGSQGALWRRRGVRADARAPRTRTSQGWPRSCKLAQDSDCESFYCKSRLAAQSWPNIWADPVNVARRRPSRRTTRQPMPPTPPSPSPPSTRHPPPGPVPHARAGRAGGRAGGLTAGGAAADHPGLMDRAAPPGSSRPALAAAAAALRGIGATHVAW